MLAVLTLGAYLVIRLNVAKGLPWSVNFSVVATLVVTVAAAISGTLSRLLKWMRGSLPLSDGRVVGGGTGRGKEPHLEAAVHMFPDELLVPSLAEEKQVTTREYTASGVLEEQPIPWTDAALPSVAVTAALLVFNQSLLGIFCLTVCLSILGRCLYRVNLRLAIQPLSTGPWSLRMTWDLIELEADGVVTRLTPDDVEEAELRALYRWRGRDLPVSTVQLRLRPGVTVPYLSPDGWFPMYWDLNFSTPHLPTELIAVLHRFTGGQFGERLAALAKLRHVGQA